MFRHPKYYKELRKRNKSDQAISHANSTRGPSDVRPDPGLQATSPKQQASSSKRIKQQATSIKPQAQRLKLQATSFKRQDS